jgi:hypothetical protein
MWAVRPNIVDPKGESPLGRRGVISQDSGEIGEEALTRAATEPPKMNPPVRWQGGPVSAAVAVRPRLAVTLAADTGRRH